MRENNLGNFYQEWVKKAEDDILWAKSAFRDKIYYGCCFSCQQSAEKALKGYLFFKTKKEPRKLHDLMVLLTQCQRLESEFEIIREGCASLTDYAVQTRYPFFGEFAKYTKEQAQEALEKAEEILGFVKQRLSIR